MAYKLKTGSWRGSYHLADGRKAQQVFGTKAEAEAYERKGKEAVSAGSHVDPRSGKQSFGEYGRSWLAMQVNSASTTASDRSRFKRVLAEWEDTPLNRIQHSRVQAWVKVLEAQGLSAWTVVSVYSLFHRCLLAAVRDKKLTEDPCAGVRLPEKPSGRKVFLTRDEVDALADVMRARKPGRGEFDAMVLYLAVNTGLRRSELAGLDVAQLAMLQHKITVDRALLDVDGHFIPKDRPKNGKSRHVWFPDEVGDMLARHLAIHPPYEDELGELVFRPASLGWPSGKAPALGKSWAKIAFNPAVVAVFGCESDVHPHDLRHTYASWLLQSGEVDLPTLMVLMGHSTIDQTMEYAHLRPDAGAVSRKALERPREETGPHGRFRPMPGV